MIFFFFWQTPAGYLRISLYSDNMRAANKKQIIILLFLFLTNLLISITALVLALLVGPLHNNPSSFILTSNSSVYSQYKYLSTEHRLFFTTNIGLGFSLLATFVSCIWAIVEYRKKQTLQSSVRRQDSHFLERLYICVSCGALGSIIGAGLQLSVLLQTNEQKSWSKWLSMSLAGLNQFLYIVIFLYILFSHTSASGQYQLDSPLTPRERVAEDRKPFMCQKHSNNKPIEFKISSNPHRVQEFQPVYRQMPKMFIRSSKPRKTKNEKIAQPIHESHKTPLIASENEGEKPEREESEGSDPPSYPQNVENLSNQSQKWKDKIPKLQMQLINSKFNSKQRDIPHLNQLEISVIKPKREVKTSTAQNDYALKENSPFALKQNQLNHSHSVLSHIHVGKIPSEVEKHQKPAFLKQKCGLRPSNEYERMEKKGEELNPTWQRHSISMDSD